MERSLAAAWVYSERQHRQANTEGLNYWDLYIGEMCAQMGLTVDVIAHRQLAEEHTLSRYSCILVGRLSEGAANVEARDRLARWVSRGGLLVGFATQGLDDLFGLTEAGATVEQPTGNPFTQTAYVRLRAASVGEDSLPYLHPTKPLLAYGEARAVRARGATVLADLVDLDHQRTFGAGTTVNRVGTGWAAYFAFSLPQTVWVLHQGRPVDRDWDGDGYYRTGDLFVIGDNEIEIPYADHFIWLLESILARHPHPSIYTMPPTQGKVPTALFYWVGDDEFVAGDQLRASNYLRSLGLPYHINLMYQDGEFSISAAEAQAIRNNGHDFSLHYNFVPSNGFPSGKEFSAEDVRVQAEAFAAHFGCYPHATVNHWLRWVGWADPARWMSEAGGKGDGSFVHARMPPLDPCDVFGFPFGTSFPFRFYDDWRSGNERLDFVEKPITGYEMGYSPEATHYANLHRLLDLTHRQHLMTSLFYHSNRIAGIAKCRDAITEVLSYLNDQKVVAKHLSLDGVVRWWLARLGSSIVDVVLTDGGMQMGVLVESSDGLVVRVPVGERQVSTVLCDGVANHHEIWSERGQRWLMVPVSVGEHQLDVRWG